MKKIRKINLDLNKEVISSLSNDDMSQVKGGASTLQMSAFYNDKGFCGSCPIDTTPTMTGAATKCLCIVSDDCASKNGTCYISHVIVVCNPESQDCEAIITPGTKAC